MTELRRTIDEIRFLIQDDGFVVTDQMTQCAQDYAVLCREANVRLRKCEEFLNQGLRSEALHIAEIAPNLLDLVAQLDFPEREQWVELLVGYSLPKPEPLLLDVAATLNEAYAVQEPLQRLLDQHRLYALARSPLTQRLDVLRSLVEFDPATPHWESDLREMELARFREVEAEARVAISKGNIDFLKNLILELSSGQWRETVPANLLKELKQKGGNVARNQARSQLVILEDALREAHSSMNLEEARRVREVWRKHAKVAQLADDDELARQAAPVLEWIEDDDRRDAAEKAYRRAIADLERHVDDASLTAAELQRFGQAVEKCGRGIPEALKLRYRNQHANLQLGESRRNRLKIGAVVSSVLGVVGVIGFAVYLGSESERSRKVLSALETLIAESQLTEASQLLEANASRLATDEGLAIRKRLSAAVQAERERVAKFNAAIDTGGQFQNLATSQTALKQARALAVTADEKIAVSKLEAGWQARHSTEVARDEAEFRAIVEAATARLQKLDALLAAHAPDAEIRTVMDEARVDLAGLRVFESKVAKELMSQATLLQSRYDSFHKAYAESQRKNAHLAKLSQLLLPVEKGDEASSRLRDYRASLEQFVVAFPNDARTPGFKSARNAEAIQEAQIRSRLTAEWRQFWPVDEAEVDKRVKSCEAFLTEHAASPDCGAVRQYLAFLKSLQWREVGDDDSDRPVKSRLRSLFSGTLMREGNLIRTKDGKRYYLTEEADYTGRKTVSLKFITGFNGEVKSTKDMDIELLETLKTQQPPQKRIADEIYESVTDVKLEAWDRYLHQLAQTLIASKEVDDFLRYFLLLRTLQYAGNGNQFLEAELKKTLAAMSDSQLDLSATWMDPTDSSAKSARQLAGILLRRVTNLDEAWQRAAAAQANLDRELFRETVPVGWVERNTDRRWILRTTWSTERAHTLMCVSHASEDGSRSWISIGTVTGSVADLNLPNSGGPLEGTVVFATPALETRKVAATR